MCGDTSPNIKNFCWVQINLQTNTITQRSDTVVDDTATESLRSVAGWQRRRY